MKKPTIALLALTWAATASAQTVVIDFGSDSTYRGKNAAGNVNSVGFGFASDLVDSTGSATTIDYAPNGLGDTDSFNGPGYDSQYTGYSDLTAEQQQAAIDQMAIASNAIIDNGALGLLGQGDIAMDYFVSNNVTNSVGRFQIQQVAAGQQYELGFFGSREFPGDTETRFSVFDDNNYSNLLGTATLTVGSGGTANHDTIATITVTGPSNANNILDFQWEGTTTSTAGYINGMTVTAVPEPSAYALIAGTFVLGWIMVRRRR